MRSALLLTSLLLTLPSFAACSDKGGTPDIGGHDQRVTDLKLADRGVDLADAALGDGGGCAPDVARCEKNVVERCNGAGTAYVAERDCDKLKNPSATFTCEVCAGTPQAVCKASRVLFSGQTTGDVAAINYSYQEQCGALVATASFANGGFSHSVHPAGLADGAYPNLLLDAPDLSKAPSGTFLLFSAGAGQDVPVLVTVSIGPGVDCKNTAPAGAGTPPGAGTATLTYGNTSAGDTMSIVLDGWLTCDQGQTWKKFGYNASGIAFY